MDQAHKIEELKIENRRLKEEVEWLTMYREIYNSESAVFSAHYDTEVGKLTIEIARLTNGFMRILGLSGDDSRALVLQAKTIALRTIKPIAPPFPEPLEPSGLPLDSSEHEESQPVS